jgi:hypothetical protein
MSEKKELALGKRSSKYLLLPVVIACAGFLASCGGGSDSTSTAESADGTKEALAVSGAAAVPPGWTGRAPKMEVINGKIVPPEPAPSINNATLAGVDVNANGVRDDVERRIAATAINTKDFEKTMQEAKYYQRIAAGPLPENRAAAIKVEKIYSCAIEQAGSIPKDLASATLPNSLRNTVINTAARKSSLDAHYRILGGYVDGEEAACDQ